MAPRQPALLGHAGSALPRTSAVEVTQVSKSYGDRQVLRDVSLQVDTGEVFGLLGPNGAGKTTLVECLVGLRRPDAGRIEVLGMHPLEQRAAFTARVSVQPQDANLFENIRVVEALDLFASMYRAPLSTRDVIDQIGLADSDRQLVRKLSGGQRRRLMLGVAMIGDPELIVLDEPSAGLDPQARRGLWSVIRRLRDSGTTVLLTTHHMDEATELCDRVAFLVDGRPAAVGTPTELVGQLAAGQQVAFETAADPDLVRSDLTRAGAVRSVTVSGRPGQARFIVHTDNSDAVVSLISRSDWKAHRISIEQGDLENVFLTLAGAEADADTATPETDRPRRGGSWRKGRGR